MIEGLDVVLVVATGRVWAVSGGEGTRDRKDGRRDQKGVAG